MCFLASYLLFSAKTVRILFWTLKPCTSENGNAHFSSFTNPTLIICLAVGSKKDTDVCIIWGYQKEGMLILLLEHQWWDSPCPGGRWEMHWAEVCLPTGCGQGDFRCPKLEQLSKVEFSCLCFSVSLTFLKYFWAGEANGFSYSGKVFIPLMSLTSKQGFALSTYG